MVSHYNLQGDNLTKAEKLPEEKSANKKNDTKHYINFGEEDQMEIQGFVFSKLKSSMCTVFYLTTLGILRLVFHWYPVWHLKATHRRTDLKNAEKVLIADNYHGKATSHFVRNIITLNSDSLQGNYGDGLKKMLKFRLQDGQTKEQYEINVINCKKLTYIWDEDKGKFIKLAGLENGITRANLHEFNGQSKEEQIRKRTVYGDNKIATPEQTVMQLLVLEALTPFYIFQLFSLVVWSAEQYYYYAVAIVIMSVVGIATSIIQTRKNQKNLKGTVAFTSIATVYRGDDIYEEMSTTNLVPGDVIVIPQYGCEMHCDAVLLSGSCIVNESMLTGESVPITKTSLDHHETLYDLKEDANHTLFCGTKVIQTRARNNEKVLAVVIRTGFLTSKGELVRSILYPPPADFKFDRDSYKYIGILAFIAACGFIYTIVSKLQREVAGMDTIIKALDIITIVIPPALPAAMTVGKLFAIHRLKKSNIFCINSRVINVSGSVDCVCFDKTGTLTEDALDLWAVVPVREKLLVAPIKKILELPSTCGLLKGMTVCHSLTSIDGEVVGDPLDVKMFESTKWMFEDNHHISKSYGSFTPSALVRSPVNMADEIGIVKQFQFSSSLQRMSVIIKSLEAVTFEVFCKGSPEKIISLSNKDTVPNDIHQQLKEYTELGYRVIGVASKKLPDHLTYQNIVKMHRDEVENELEFLGLLIFENRLKPETTGIIKTLKDAQLKVVMITGDNIQTAVTVARECLIIEKDCTVIEVLTEKPTRNEFASISYHVLTQQSNKEASINILNGTNGKSKDVNMKYSFVITGQSWSNIVKYFPDLVPKIVTKGAVFARMSGSQKQHLVEEFKNLGYYVAMCGDGANDCGALKAAHVGISLSEAESSVASPFTSKEPNISCVPKVVKEGRAALVTSFGVFQMMLCYSLTEFLSVIILYDIDTNLSSMQFLFIDVCLILNFAATFGRTPAYPKLSKTAPRTSLLSFIPICSMTLLMLLVSVSQRLAFYWITTYQWFTPFVYDPSDAGITSFNPSYENYAVYCTSMFQYIAMAIIFSKGKPYRKHMFTNKIFVFCLFAMTIVSGYMTLYTPEWLASIMELKVPPEMDGRMMCIYIAVGTFVACYIVQCLFVEIFLEKIVEPALSRLSKNKKPYLEVMKSLQRDSYWPPTSTELTKLDYVNENGKINGYHNAAFDSYQF
ncbi:unnamed protein product [Ceutorhynchus assimilis]|uniref:Cation-transporting ATPase n=1 Tax=Ceutorhynchus assimilis TaxID=467358 RepID=A0A9N9MX96_9CUCU|nr:unnamed protein product [Ceutorhynchus assimilis]